ncbi:hypothetical protein HPB49_025962 [Dermacentor silvarum]|nr:hypothetical protein HPB49_025962 [Dermacentor silvarum]
MLEPGHHEHSQGLCATPSGANIQKQWRYSGADSPEELLAEGAEGGLSEEFLDEFVTLDLEDFLVLDGAPAAGDASGRLRFLLKRSGCASQWEGDARQIVSG